MNESATILTSASAQVEDARQAGAESLNGNGFYRIKIGDFQATVISDGYGPILVGPIFAMMRLSGGKGVDVIIDGVGGKLTGEALGCLLPGGTYAVVGYAGGREASVNLTDIIWKAAKVRGFTFRGFAPETLAAAQKTLIGYLSEGAIQPTIAKVFPLSDAADAVRHLIEERPFGRVLMRVED